MSQQKRSWRDVIEVHAATKLFPMMSPDELRALGENIRENGLISSVVLWCAGDGPFYLLDGRNRLDAMEAVGLSIVSGDGKLLVATFRCGPEVDPYEYVLSANVYRRHLTRAQKRELIAKLLKAKPEKSNRTIARQTKADDKTVAAIRGKLESTAEIPQLTKTVGADGKARTTTPTRRARRTAADFIADRNEPAMVVADCAEERTQQQAKCVDEHMPSAAVAADPVEPKQSDIELELPDADRLARKIIERDAIEPGYALAVARRIATHLNDGYPEMPAFLKRTVGPTVPSTRT